MGGSEALQFMLDRLWSPFLSFHDNTILVTFIKLFVYCRSSNQVLALATYISSTKIRIWDISNWFQWIWYGPIG